MKFKIDENVPPFVAGLLRADGHDALTVAEQSLSGAVDERLATICSQEGRVLVTLDLDFSDIRQYAPGSGPGFVVLRPKRNDRADIEQTVNMLLVGLAKDEVSGNLWIVRHTSIRVRDRGSNEPQ